MAKKKTLETILNEDLKRFNEIGNYVKNLDEQFLGFASSNRFDLSEQDEEPADEETPIEEPADEEVPAEEQTDDLELDLEDTPTEESPEGDLDLGADLGGSDENTEEIDVTDIVTMTKETGKKTEELGGTIEKQNSSIDSLISKLDDLEVKLNDMDKMMASISNLENKIEEYRPQTPEEKLELRYLDSGPFNQSPKKYWEEKQGKLKQQKDKHDYVLTSDEVDDYNESDIKNSWVYNPEEEDN